MFEHTHTSAFLQLINLTFLELHVFVFIELFLYSTQLHWSKSLAQSLAKSEIKDTLSPYKGVIMNRLATVASLLIQQI